MITRVVIHAQGGSASEVERHLHWLADQIAASLGEQVGPESGPFASAICAGEQHIERNMAESEGCFCAHSGRLNLHPNVADDAVQARLLREEAGGCTTVTMDVNGNQTEFGKSISGGTPYVGIAEPTPVAAE